MTKRRKEQTMQWQKEEKNKRTNNTMTKRTKEQTIQ
jgi:hypothetical protein